MKVRALLVCGAFALMALGNASQASACVGNGNGPIGQVVRTAIPTMAEVQAVPLPGQGRLVHYPVRVVQYGLNVHPGARLVRAALFR